MAPEVWDWAGGWARMDHLTGALVEEGVLRTYVAMGNLTAFAACSVGSISAVLDHDDTAACDHCIGKCVMGAVVVEM